MKTECSPRSTEIILALLLLAAVTAGAATLTVTSAADSGGGTLRAAVAFASSGDTINFSSTLSGSTILLTSGQIFLGNNVTIDGSALTNGIMLNGDYTNRIFQVNSNTTVMLNSLIITNGNLTDNYGDNIAGGGIYNDGTLTVSNCTLANNSIVGGGQPAGGGIYNDGMLNVNNSTFANNSASGGGYSDSGGGIYNSGTLIVSKCNFANNNVFGFDWGYGGGIYNSGTLTANNSAFASNIAIGASDSGFGGGIYNTSGTINVNNCTFANNAVDATSWGCAGAGIYNTSGTLNVNNSTIANNYAHGENPAVGGGIYNGGVLNLTNSIVCSNTASTFPNIFGSYPAANNLVDTNALLAPLGNYGGPTQAMPPLPGSPAIDAGNDSAAAGFATDQRDYPRIIGTHVDIGAVEGIYVANGPGLLTGMTNLGNGSIQFSFTNLTDASFTVLASSNLALPKSAWSIIGTAMETPAGSGQYEFTDPQATNNSDRFYRVRSP